MDSMSDNPLLKEDSLLGELLRNGLKGQQDILDRQLQQGVPLARQDDEGRLFLLQPDGSREYVTPDSDLLSK